MASVESAVRIAIQNATVVKKPKTFCALTRLECILTGGLLGGRRCLNNGDSRILYTVPCLRSLFPRFTLFVLAQDFELSYHTTLRYLTVTSYLTELAWPIQLVEACPRSLESQSFLNMSKTKC